MKITLNKDDYYEIEKICDIYSSWVYEKLQSVCNTAINWSVKSKEKCPLDDTIRQLDNSLKQIKIIREKLEKMRLNDKSRKVR